MIYNESKDWRQLQDNVSAVLNQIGLKSETNKVLKTPRGEVEIDVYATDPSNIDRIVYLAECKNWENRVSQTVIHAFNTVMQETGANVGYIISKKGFQKGAINYTSNTNISILTFDEFQNKYLHKWLGAYFCAVIDEASDAIIQYSEPINSRRERSFSSLSVADQQAFITLRKKYFDFSFLLLQLTSHNEKRELKVKFGSIEDIGEFELLKKSLATYTFRQYSSSCYSELLDELRMAIEDVTDEFNMIFGSNIFDG